jgi:hypothetical protein
VLLHRAWLAKHVHVQAFVFGKIGTDRRMFNTRGIEHELLRKREKEKSKIVTGTETQFREL